jgi:hypothetical protein
MFASASANCFVHARLFALWNSTQDASLTVDDAVIIKRGLMAKKTSGRVASWHMRYFTASGTSLTYFEASDTELLHPKGSVELTSDCSAFKKAEGKPKFTIDFGHEFTAEFKCDEEDEADDWVAVLEDMIQQQKAKESGQVEDNATFAAASIFGQAAKHLEPSEDDGSRMWVSVNVRSARKLAAKDFGLLSSGKSDPYVLVHALFTRPGGGGEAGGAGGGGGEPGKELIGRTSTKMKTLEPEWDEELGSFCAAGATLLIEVYDHDQASGDDIIGSFTVDNPGAAAHRNFKFTTVFHGGKEQGEVEIAINVQDGTVGVDALGDTVDKELPATMWPMLHQTCYHANINVSHGSHYPYNAVCHHIARGAAKLEGVVRQGEGFESKQEVCEFAWLLFYKVGGAISHTLTALQQPLHSHE